MSCIALLLLLASRRKWIFCIRLCRSAFTFMYSCLVTIITFWSYFRKFKRPISYVVGHRGSYCRSICIFWEGGHWKYRLTQSNWHLRISSPRTLGEHAALEFCSCAYDFFAWIIWIHMCFRRWINSYTILNCTGSLLYMLIILCGIWRFVFWLDPKVHFLPRHTCSIRSS